MIGRSPNAFARRFRNLRVTGVPEVTEDLVKLMLPAESSRIATASP